MTTLLEAWQNHLQNFMHHLSNVYWAHPNRMITAHPDYVEGGPVPAPIHRTPEQIAKNLVDYEEMMVHYKQINESWYTPDDWFVQEWENTRV